MLSTAMSELEKSRVVVITGAFGALGTAVARVLGGAGDRLALLDLAQPSAELQREFPGPRHLLLGGADLADEEATRKTMAAVAMRLGGIDVLVNVAGGFRWEKVEGGSLDTWDMLYAINLRSAVVSCKCALPAILERGGRGRIINVGAGAAGRAGLGMGAYAASKSGVQRLTEALAEELKDRNVTVNAILPGTIDTPRNRLDMPKADFSRWVSPEQIARVILFLASDDASAITGVAIPVSGRA
jgi:NAD(P)-dependent dehydrogenase (short-subunit alcohol dehydrogenase family)